MCGEKEEKRLPVDLAASLDEVVGSQQTTVRELAQTVGRAALPFSEGPDQTVASKEEK